MFNFVCKTLRLPDNPKQGFRLVDHDLQRERLYAVMHYLRTMRSESPSHRIVVEVEAKAEKGDFSLLC